MLSTVLSAVFLRIPQHKVYYFDDANLKIFRNDLKLWQAFAEIEWLSGNTDEARRVFDSTLMMAGEMFSDEQSRRMALAPLVRYDHAVQSFISMYCRI